MYACTPCCANALPRLGSVWPLHCADGIVSELACVGKNTPIQRIRASRATVPPKFNAEKAAIRVRGTWAEALSLLPSLLHFLALHLVMVHCREPKSDSVMAMSRCHTHAEGQWRRVGGRSAANGWETKEMRVHVWAMSLAPVACEMHQPGSRL